MKTAFKKTLKRIGLGIVLALLFAGGFVLIFSEDIEHWMAARLEDYLTEMEYGELEIEDIDLAFFRNFPNISLVLNKVRFHERESSLRDSPDTPILFAERIYLAFEPLEFVWNRKLIVTHFGMEDGVINLLTYPDNETNLEKAFSFRRHERPPLGARDTATVGRPEARTKKTAGKLPSSQSDESLEIRLEDIYMEDILVRHEDPIRKSSSRAVLEEVHGATSLGDAGFTCDLDVLFEIYETAWLPSLADQGSYRLKLNLEYLAANQEIVVQRGELNFEKFFIELKGAYDHKNGKRVDMVFDASSNDLAFLSQVVQEDILRQNRSAFEKADLVLKGSIEGEMEDNIPEVDLEFGVTDFSVRDPSGKVSIRNLGFKGEFHSGENDDFSGAVLTLHDLRGVLKGGDVSGDFYLRNFQQPYVRSTIKASLDLDGYDAVFNLPGIDSLQGRISLTTDINGKLNLDQEHGLDSIGSWKLHLQDIGFYYQPFEKKVSQFGGILRESRNEMILEGLSMKYDSSDLSLQGRISNLYHFIFNREQAIEAALELTSSQFYTAHFVTNPDRKANINDRISDLRLVAEITGKDNVDYDAYFPSIHANLKELSMDLDRLPGIAKLEGKIDFQELPGGYVFDLQDLRGVMQTGVVGVSGRVEIPSDFQKLDLDVHLFMDDVGVEYAHELINALKDRPLLGARNMEESELTMVDGKADVSGIMELLPFGLSEVGVKQADMFLRTPDSSVYKARDLNLQLDSLNFMRNPDSAGILGIRSAAGALEAAEISTPVVSKSPFKVGFSADNDQVRFAFSAPGNSGGKDAGSLMLDFTDTPAAYELQYEIEEMELSSVLEDYTTKNLMDGMIDVSILLKGTAGDWSTIEAGAEGNIFISSDSLVIRGLALDELLSKYRRSQNFNLADVGAFVVAGPLGTAVTKGADFTTLITAELKPDDKTLVSKAHLQWGVENGFLQTEDVAFRTERNRLAFQGGIDFVNDSIPGLTVYLIDKKGCSLMEQRIYGRTNDLKTGKLKIAETLLGSVINLVKSVVGDDCRPVYSGRIVHPIHSE